ncbi:molybdopterin-dependent oxidoreductase [Mycobacterium sp. shizuoka-1]|uniref:molybdopterin-dependent oxidoreductase n=1 Tax=Mycobacterium sp. shizuoka-1 TaxID=2039281 RepID=UPI000C05F3FA|nr:molybdopterin-dependent oxidoreductase [Mycobacterium sp. shizuoka-1]GAY18657.1 hypothetical protein MSZK_53830 [Mycobacterium sp. shizuoka-1]
MRTRLLAVFTATTVSILVPVSCATSAGHEDTHQPAPTTNAYGAGPIDPPAPGQPVLTVSGGSTPLSLTLDQLDALGHTTITIDEPFVKRRETYSGVPLATVLAKAGIPATATIDTLAINDYHYISTAKPMIESNGLIATARDGAPIPYDQGGPIRIVFPDDAALSSVLDAWNWSLTSITVTPAGGPGS